MTVTHRFPSDTNVIIPGDLTVGGTLRPPQTRTNHAQEDLARFPYDLTALRVWDARQTALPGTSAADDLGLYGGTWGTNAIRVMTYDVKTVGATNLYAAGRLALPTEYQAAETVVIRCSAGMVGAVADASCTLDLECYLIDRVGGLDGSPTDLCATAATTMNSLTFANIDFTITATGLARGDELEFRLNVAPNDAAGGSSVQGAIAAIELLCDIKG